MCFVVVYNYLVIKINTECEDFCLLKSILYIKLFSNAMFIFQSHKHAWPFMKPVDPLEAPDYYKVIKEPMGKNIFENIYT